MSAHRIRLKSRCLSGFEFAFESGSLRSARSLTLLALALALGAALLGCASSSPYDESGMAPNGGDGQLICSVTRQDCGAGSKCSTHDSRSSVCDVDGPAARGLDCTNIGSGAGAGGPDDCTAGTVCVVESATVNQCRQFCASDGDCGTGSFCYYRLGEGRFQLCTQPCSALLPATNGCQHGLFCYVFGEEYTDCKAPGQVGANGSCASTFDCQPGYTCVSAGTSGAGRCHQVCRYSNDCPTGTLCYDIQGSKGAWRDHGECH